MNESTKDRCDMIIGRDPLTYLVLDLKCSKHAITGGDVPYEGLTDTIVDMITYDYELLNLKDLVKLEE